MVVDVNKEPSKHRATLSLNRPEKQNVLSPEVIDKLTDALKNIEDEDDIRVGIITGSDGVFSAGADIDEFIARIEDPKSLYNYIRSFSSFYQAFEQSRLPLIAMIDGPAHGGGSELAMSCDLRVATPRAELRQAEINIALAPPFERLRSHLSQGRIRELCLTGRPLSAEEAENAGVFNKVVELEELESTTHELAKQIASKSPNAVRLAREAFDYAEGKTDQESIDYRHSLVYRCITHPDFHESITAFKEGRTPEFQ